jgi:glycosyltransferase involved in cell wall biosynthesis
MPPAVVIPAYKTRYLAEALASLAGQTRRDFPVYIGDDASPEDLRSVADAFRDRLNLRYTRFDENLGGRNLTAHWNRCVRMCREPWIWLFSDDDRADSACLEAAAMLTDDPATTAELVRFQTRTIDGTGLALRENPPHPAFETAGDFILARLTRGRLSFACEYVFRRESFDREGGFVSFPLAWCSDDASWGAFARQGGIRTVSGPRVDWRISSHNLSAVAPAHRQAKREALLQYLEWLDRQLAAGLADDSAQAARIRAAMEPWFWHQLNVADAMADRAAVGRMRSAAGTLGATGSTGSLRHNLALGGLRMKRAIKKGLGRA